MPGKMTSLGFADEIIYDPDGTQEAIYVPITDKIYAMAWIADTYGEFAKYRFTVWYDPGGYTLPRPDTEQTEESWFVATIPLDPLMLACMIHNLRANPPTSKLETHEMLDANR